MVVMFFLSLCTLYISSIALSVNAITPPSFRDVLSSHKNLSTLKNVLSDSHPSLLSLIAAQPSSNPITVLAPSNEAFAKTTYYPILGPAFDHGDVDAIQNILSYHVIAGYHPSTSLLPQFQYFPTWLSNGTFSNVTGGQRVGGVMQSGKQMVWTSGQSSRSIVTEPDGMDIVFAGGVIHIIESLVTPPSSFPMTAELFSTAAEPYQLTSFLGATYFSLNKSVPLLSRYLNSTSDLTIFAPNNAGMESVASVLASLAQNPPALTNLLGYHIVASKPGSGPWYSTNFTNGTTLQTISGGSLTITSAFNSLFVNSAKIITADLLLQNGVMHVMDNVLSPDDAGAVPRPSLATQQPVLAPNPDSSVSQAPFTTFMPWAVVTDLPESSFSRGSSATGAGGATVTGSGSGNEGCVGCNRNSGEGNMVGRPFAFAWTGVMIIIGVLYLTA
jgi:transforming growth factor-beta-induced protein